MLEPYELALSDMGDLADIIPGPDPELRATIRPISRFEQDTTRPIIPVCEPTLTGNELKYVTECVQTNWISSAGRFIREFERTFAEACGTRHGVA